MTLKILLMEKNQLNFNQPLLSVRRGSSIAASNERKTNNTHPSLPPFPYYKSELKSGPVRNPGAVPFKWEQMPGRPKDEKKPRQDVLKWVSPAPNLPPGRIANHMQKQTDEVLRDLPTSSSRCRTEANNPHSLEVSSLDNVLSEVEGSEKEKEKDSSSSEDENVVFVDASDTLSRTESFFNCSVSGVSGLEGPESFGTVSDHQTRDFMMGRFLPAAKAVASETPSYASRRHPVVREQAKPITNLVKYKQSPQYYSVPDTLPHRNNGEGNDEEEDEEYESDGPEDFSVKLCGLMPRFCLLNPIPGIRDHVQVIPTVRSVRTRPAYSAVCRDNKHMERTKNKRGALKRTAHHHAPATTNESLINGHLGRIGMARQKSASPQFFLDREKKQVLGLHGEPRDLSHLLNLPKNSHTELDFAAHHDTENTRIKPADEKTLFVDSERVTESWHSNTSSSESRGRNPSVDYSLQDIKSLCFAEDKTIPQSKGSEITEFSAFSTSKRSYHDVSEDMKNLQKNNQNIDLIVDVKQPLKPDGNFMKHTQKCSSLLALTPLLPKSPSESWLSRTLPSMSLRKPSPNSYLTNQAFKSSPVDPKRETLLKTLDVQNMPIRSVRELAPILEN